MIVMKFGGSSVADAARLRNISEIVKSRVLRKPAVVLSAMGDTTDYLIEAGETALKNGKIEISKIRKIHLSAVKALKLSNVKEIEALLDELARLLSGVALLRELTPRTRDYLVSFGERLSVRIAAALFRQMQMNAAAFDAWEMGFITDSNYGKAELKNECWETIPEKILQQIKGNVLPVITGFIGKDENGVITTLGRGGSDLSATIIASSCRAEEVQIWKDVDGILTADPRIVKDAHPVENISFEEAAELAFYGTQVLHPRAMQPCLKTGTPVIVKNSYNEEAPGTRIEQAPSASAAAGRGSAAKGVKKKPPVRTISMRRNIKLVDIVSTRMLGQYGFLQEVFAVFAKNKISVDMVATSEVSISLTLDDSCDLSEVKKELSKFSSVEVKHGKAIISIIGNVKRSSEILSRAFRICQLIGVPVQMVSQGASKVNISFIVNDQEAEETVKALHIDFFDKLT